jgi:septum formation protein
MRKIILASQSPRRKQLLEWAEVPFEVIVKSTEETYPEGLPAEEIPIYIARQKAIAVKNSLIEEGKTEIESSIILAADTVVVLDKQIIGKPVDRNDAIRILTSLSGKEHQVITGVVIQSGGEEKAFSDVTSVNFHTLTNDQITFYVDKYKPFDKAGAYAIQEWIGVVGIKSVRGDFYNVMGLPVSRVVQQLTELGLLALKGS